MSALERVDVFCNSHEQFMPLRTLPGVLRSAVLLFWAAAVCLAFLLTAELRNPVPVLLAAATVGAAVVALPLRFYPEPWLFVLIGWAVATTVSVLFVDAPAGRSLAPVLTTVAVLALAAWLVRLAAAAFAFVGDAEHSDIAGVTAMVAVLLAASAAPAAFVFAAGAAPAESLLSVPDGWAGGVLAVALWIAAGAGFLAAAVAALMGMAYVVERDTRPIPLPHRPGRLARPSLPARRAVVGPRDPFSQLARTISRFAVQFAHAVSVGLTMVGNTALRVWHILAVLAVSILNWLVGWMSSLARILLETGRLLIAAARVATRVVLVPVLGLTVGAWCLTSFSRSALRYLTAGGPLDVVALLAFGVGGAGSLVVVWMALCGLPLTRSAGSAMRSATVSAAWLLLILVAGGWTIGLFGTFGHGPISVGWFTTSATAVLVLVAVVAGFRARSRESHA